MTATEQYIRSLESLKEGDLGLLRSHAGQSLDETVEGFDLFAGLWWPLRQKSASAPRREVAWLVAKLYAACPYPSSDTAGLPRQLRRCEPSEPLAKERYIQRFDRMLSLPLNHIEPALRWALDTVSSKELAINWIQLTDDLSIWERPTVRRRWAEEFLESNKRGMQC